MTGIVDVLSGITQGANALSAAKQAHDHVKDLVRTYKPKSHDLYPLSLFFEDTIIKNKPTKVWGQGVGLISLYSQSELVLQAIPDRQGYYFALLTFSKSGEYAMSVRNATEKVEKTILVKES